jgi:hypothetical protein
MKSFYPVTFAAVIALSCLGPKTCAANSTNTQAAGATNSTNAPAINTNYFAREIPIPLSVFDITNTPTKDPFFPLSTRQPVPQVATNVTLTFNASSFLLKGLSGSPGHPLALVNNRTLAPGEDAEITAANGGKVKIHCVAIRTASVVLSIPTQSDPIEVFLRKTAQ